MARGRGTTSRESADDAARRASAGRTRGRRHAPVVVVAVVVAVALGVTFAALVPGDIGEEAPPGSSGGAGLAHVHGLGVDPADGMLLAGSHHGLFRVPAEGAVSRVGEREQDLMGFTVAGPRHYLASGHPGPDQDGPSSLGLIESTDGGQTWQSLSLSGQADFHALEVRHGLVYGYDSLTGTLMVSDDKRHWQTRARLPIADLAVSPDDPDVLIVTTEQGPARSRDGGRTFQVLSGAPVLLLVSWADDGTLIGVQPDGVVHASGDGAGVWRRRGRLPGPPEALQAVSGRRLFAAAGGKVLESTDGGRSFDVRHGG